MTRIRRLAHHHDVIFTTHVTYERRPLLAIHADHFLNAVQRQLERTPFELVAWVILPDHVHLLTDTRGHSLSSTMKKIKQSFSESIRRKAELSGRIWQYRFWDHVIRDDDDLRRHIDYIHFNPVKHGVVSAPSSYAHSSFHEYVKRGQYAVDWCDGAAISGDFGE